jgi:hypothetical protein
LRAAIDRPALSGRHYPPSNPGTHRPQARTILVPQQAHARFRIDGNIGRIVGIVLDSDNPGRPALGDTRQAPRLPADHIDGALEERLALLTLVIGLSRYRQDCSDQR